MFVINTIITTQRWQYSFAKQNNKQEENVERKYFVWIFTFLSEDFVWFNSGVQPGGRSNILGSFFAGIGTHDQLGVDKKISEKKFESESW